MNTPPYDETEEEFKAPEASTPEEKLWREKRDYIKTLAENMWTEVEQLMIKGKIPCKTPESPNYLDWSWQLLPEIFEKRLSRDREDFRGFASFLSFVGGSPSFHDGCAFDLPGDALQTCAESLLLELRVANASDSTEVLKF